MAAKTLRKISIHFSDEIRVEKLMKFGGKPADFLASVCAKACG